MGGCYTKTEKQAGALGTKTIDDNFINTKV